MRSLAVSAQLARPSLGGIALAITAITIAALLHVWVRLQVISIGYDISRETRLRHDLIEVNQRLSLELRTRMDLATIERAAVGQLQMAAPDPRAIRVLRVPMELAEVTPPEGSHRTLKGRRVQRMPERPR